MTTILLWCYVRRYLLNVCQHRRLVIISSETLLFMNIFYLVVCKDNSSYIYHFRWDAMYYFWSEWMLLFDLGYFILNIHVCITEYVCNITWAAGQLAARNRKVAGLNAPSWLGEVSTNVPLSKTLIHSDLQEQLGLRVSAKWVEIDMWSIFRCTVFQGFTV